MECTILKAFPLSRDGIKSEMQTAGAVVDVPDALVGGLEAAGYVAKGRVTVSAASQPVVGETGGTVQADAGEPAKPASEEPVVGETKAAGGKARQSKDHQVQ